VSGTDVTITTMSSGTRRIDTARQGTTYRAGRVLLAGDAAPVYAPDVDALLIRPDGCVAQNLPTGRDLDVTTLVRALGIWFGQPA